MKHIAVFASGNGSNAENIIRYFKLHDLGWEVSVVVSNRADAYVLQRAERQNVPSVVMTKDQFNNQTEISLVLEQYSVDAIVLAGFLLMIPTWLISRYPERIINIHPSLLPKYGGRGMYGRHVHEAVVAAGERESGITIHIVNEDCDGGKVLFQARTEVTVEDSAEDVEGKIHELEARYYPAVVAATLTGCEVGECIVK